MSGLGPIESQCGIARIRDQAVGDVDFRFVLKFGVRT